MVYVALFITAELEGLTNLQPRNGFDDPDHPYLFKLKCENCGEISKKPSCVSLSEQVPLPNGRGTVQMIQKCKLCDREGTVEIISGQGKPLTEFHGQNHQHVQLVIFDCHGLSPVEFSFGGQWKAESTKSKTTFEIDLSRGEFADYDEDGNCAVSVSNLRSFFRVVNKLCSNWCRPSVTYSKTLWKIDLSEGEFHNDDKRVHVASIKAKFEVVRFH